MGGHKYKEYDLINKIRDNDDDESKSTSFDFRITFCTTITSSQNERLNPTRPQNSISTTWGHCYCPRFEMVQFGILDRINN